MITGRVYMIVGSEHEQVYIGSTTTSLSQRLSSHKYTKRCSCKYLFNDKEVGIYLIEEGEFEDRMALRWRERYWWKIYDTINVYRPLITKIERQKQKQKTIRNYEKEKKQCSIYRENNKQYIKDRKTYQQSWGGDRRYTNNLLNIDLDIFK